MRHIALWQPYRAISCTVALLCMIALYGSLNATGEQYVPIHGGTGCTDDTIRLAVDIDGHNVTGTACVWHATSHGELLQPIIVPDGFDPDNGRTHGDMYNMIGYGIAGTMRDEGYDIITLDFDDGAGRIEQNAMLMVKLIDFLDGSMQPGYDMTVVGPSMGGLVARYALAYMESDGRDHNTGLFISLDTPHLGANVPLGNQYMVRYFGENSDASQLLEEQLYTPASRQMLIYHESAHPGVVGSLYDSYNNTLMVDGPRHDTLRDAFILALEDVGGYPQNLRMVAIANGDGYGTGQNLTEGQLMVKYNTNSTLLTLAAETHALQGGNVYNTIFEGLMDIIGSPHHQYVVQVRSVLPYDTAPGGYKSLSQDVAGEPEDLLCTSGRCLVDLGRIVAHSAAETYVPTHSALGIPLYLIGNSPYANIDLLYSNDTSITPFDALYYPRENQEHAKITAQNALWILCEIFAENDDAYQRHCT